MGKSAEERAKELVDNSSVGPGAPAPDPAEVDKVVERLRASLEGEDE